MCIINDPSYCLILDRSIRHCVQAVDLGQGDHDISFRDCLLQFIRIVQNRIILRQVIIVIHSDLHVLRNDLAFLQLIHGILDGKIILGLSSDDNNAPAVPCDRQCSVLIFDKRHCLLGNFLFCFVMGIRTHSVQSILKSCLLIRTGKIHVQNAVLFFQAQDSEHALIDALLRDRALLDFFLKSGDIAVIKLRTAAAVQVRRNQQNVNSCIEDLLRYIHTVLGGIDLAGDKSCCADGIHFKRVCHDHSVISHIAAEDLRDDLRGHGRGIKAGRLSVPECHLLIDQRVCDMRGHDHINTVINRRLKRNQLDLLNLIVGLFNGRSPDVAVDGGVAMSGEVFACPDDPVFSKAADKSAAQQRHHLRVI